MKSSTILEAAHEFVRGFVGFASEKVPLNAGFEEAFSL